MEVIKVISTSQEREKDTRKEIAREEKEMQKSDRFKQ